MLTTTILGLLFIARREALVTIPYQDGVHMSWGFGHNDPELKPGMTISPRAAFRLLVQDVVEREIIVRRSLEEPELLSPNQFDALVSAYYQGGSRNLHAMSEQINILGPNHQGVYDVFPLCNLNRAGEPKEGLTKRRLLELAVYRDNDYGELLPLPRWDGNPHDKTTPRSDYWLTWEDIA